MRTKYIIAIAILSIFAVFIISKTVVQAYNTSRPSDSQMYGYAWSSNIGWISFNNCTSATTGCSGFSYGVSMDSANVSGYYNLSGYAWSSNIGWISFTNSDLSASSCLTTCQPKVNATTGAFSGWVKALSAGNGSGGWNGYIALSSADSPGGGAWNFSVNFTTGIVTGYAWGGDVVGWISANCTNSSSCATSSYAVQIMPLSAPTVTLSASQTSLPVGGGPSTLTWTITGNPTSCLATGGWTGSKSIAGSNETIPTISSTTTYTITCSKAGFTDVSSSATVTVALVYDGPYCTANPTDSGCIAFCFNNPTDPSCVAFCPTHLTSPICIKKPVKPIFKEF